MLNIRVANAFKAMTDLGISTHRVRPVLNHLLQLYGDNWDLIEDDNYRTLADAIFESAEEKEKDQSGNSLELYSKGPPSKRPHSELQVDQTTSNKVKSQISSDPALRVTNPSFQTVSAASHPNQARDRTVVDRKASRLGNTNIQRETKRVSDTTHTNQERDRAVVDREASRIGSSLPNMNVQKEKKRVSDASHTNQVRDRAGVEREASRMGSSPRNVNAQKETNRVSVASCTNQERDRAGVDRGASRKGSSRQYMNIQKETNSVSVASHTNQERDGAGVDKEASGMSGSQRMDIKKEAERVSDASHPNQTRHRTGVDKEASRVGSSQRNMIVEKEINSTESLASRSIVVHPPPTRKKDYSRKINDITKGRENLKIALLDESGKENPPKFMYIRQNIVYQDAYIRFSLARIADDDCCSKCSGDCLSSVPCECARETGGEFAYTSEGVLRDDFLENYISMNINPQKHHYVYCTTCPLERAKDGNRPEPCKGHLIRKFVKECWDKCGCNMDCGNRVVQRGISYKLQVFLTKEGKGWGLRALQDLPKGAFVCEYVGEVLTNTELYERNMKCSHNARHTYPVLLDADWSSEGVLEDKDALCLDATNYGNVARFINHRCHDSNLIDIPVEVETPDHHYYHIAFFTKRKVDAFEELSWDYKIDFDDDTHPIEAFRCCCGSKFCRDPTVKDPIQVHPGDRRLV